MIDIKKFSFISLGFISIFYLCYAVTDEEKNELITKQQQLNIALGIAAQSGKLEEVQKLLNDGADPDVPSQQHGSRPLLKAAFYGHVEVAACLIEHGAQLDEFDETYKTTALHEAIRQGHLSMVELLINAGADMHLRTKMGNGDSPYHLAERYAQDNISKFLYKIDDYQFHAQSNFNTIAKK